MGISSYTIRVTNLIEFMAVYVSTTGTLSPVIIEELGALELVHPVVNRDLTVDFEIDILYGSDELQAAVDAGYITLSTDSAGTQPIKTISDPNSAQTGSFVDVGRVSLVAAATDLNLDWPAYTIFEMSGAGTDTAYIDLPAVASTSRRVFHFIHNGPASNDKIIFRESGTNLYTLRRNRFLLVLSDGTDWIIMTFNSDSTDTQ